MKTTRKQHKASSNNTRNSNQNICALQVATVMGVNDAVKYLHTDQDMWRALRTKFSVRSVKSSVGKTVGGSREKMAQLSEARGNIIAYVVIVQEHVLLMNHTGKTVIDTAPRKRDRRAIKSVMAVYPKSA